MSSVAPPRISVAVCTWNRSELLAKCVESLVRQEAPEPFEILVADDGSTDATAATVARLAAGTQVPVRHIVHEHAGVNATRNHALDAARGELIHFLDDDELAPEGHLARILSWFDRQPDLDGVGGPYCDHGGGLRTCPGCSLASVDVSGHGVREVPRLLGGNMTIRRRVFEEVGPFHPELSGRGDDNEWFHRATGRRFVQDPDLWVWHRRDQLSLFGLCRLAFRQGRALPRALALQGDAFSFRPVAVLRYLAHFALRRCSKGVWLAARDVGAGSAALASLVNRRSGGQR